MGRFSTKEGELRLENIKPGFMWFLLTRENMGFFIIRSRSQLQTIFLRLLLRPSVTDLETMDDVQQTSGYIVYMLSFDCWWDKPARDLFLFTDIPEQDHRGPNIKFLCIIFYRFHKGACFGNFEFTTHNHDTSLWSISAPLAFLRVSAPGAVHQLVQNW